MTDYTHPNKAKVDVQLTSIIFSLPLYLSLWHASSFCPSLPWSRTEQCDVTNIQRYHFTLGPCYTYTSEEANPNTLIFFLICFFMCPCVTLAVFIHHSPRVKIMTQAAIKVK